MSLRLLAIDTSSEACSAALYSEHQVKEHYTEQSRQHAQRLLPMVEDLLKQADVTLAQVDLLVFGQGPGSFTGLRIAAGVVQGLAFGANIPVLPVSSLALLAYRAYVEKGWHRCHVAVDARMGEVYWGSYAINEEGSIQALSEDMVVAPGQVPVNFSLNQQQGFYGVGSGWLYAQQMVPRCGPVLDCDIHLLPRARDLLSIAQKQLGDTPLAQSPGIISAHQVAPVYLRNNVAIKSAVESERK